jgi:hypothetical protein
MILSMTVEVHTCTPTSTLVTHQMWTPVRSDPTGTGAVPGTVGEQEKNVFCFLSISQFENTINRSAVSTTDGVDY